MRAAARVMPVNDELRVLVDAAREGMAGRPVKGTQTGVIRGTWVSEGWLWIEFEIDDMEGASWGGADTVSIPSPGTTMTGPAGTRRAPPRKRRAGR